LKKVPLKGTFLFDMHPLIKSLLERVGVLTYQNPDPREDNRKGDLQKCFESAFGDDNDVVVYIDDGGKVFVISSFEQLWDKRYTLAKGGIREVLTVPKEPWNLSVRNFVGPDLTVVYLGK